MAHRKNHPPASDHVHHAGVRLTVRIDAGGTAYVERYPDLDNPAKAGPVRLAFSSFNPGSDFEAAERWGLAILRAVNLARLVRDEMIYPTTTDDV